MELAFLLGVPVLTSLLAYAAGRRWLGLSSDHLSAAVARLLELLGIGLLFLVLNLAVGVMVILSLRTLTPVFLSIYLLNDLSLVGLSVVQGLLFECWRARAQKGLDSRGRL